MAGKKRVERHGITFDSKLEADIYDVFLLSDKCTIVSTQPSYLLQEPFTYDDPFKEKGKKSRSMSKMIYTSDILIRIKGLDYDVVVEVKGWNGRPDYRMRKKIFLSKYISNKELYFIEVKSVKQTIEILERL